jgi:hypothetical protein
LYDHRKFKGTIQLKLNRYGDIVSKMKGSGESRFREPKKAEAIHKEAVEFDLGKESAGEELRDLKVLVKRHFGMNVERAAFYSVGSDEPMDDTHILLDGDELYLSPPLRHAMLHGPQIGSNLADAIADAKATKYLAFPYLNAAERILITWPTKRWPNPRRALRSDDVAAQAELAQSLRPKVEEIQQFFDVRLTAWYTMLDSLSSPLNARMEEDLRRRIAETNEECLKTGFRHCAREVRMEVAAPVDYVKVEYTQADVYTKLKFFRDGRILKTRGDEVAQGKPLKLYSPTLPGGVMLSITLCKNSMTEEGFNPIRSLSNFFVTSESRCNAIGKQFNYQLTADEAIALPQKRPTDRKQFEFQVSENPKAYFQIWDGDFILGEYQPEEDLLNNLEVNVPDLKY